MLKVSLFFAGEPGRFGAEPFILREEIMTDTRRFIPIALAVLFTIPGFLPRLFHTAAQSLMAVALLVGLRLAPRGAILLFGFFIRQSFAPGVLATVSGFLPFKVGMESIHLSISVLHAMVSIYLLVKNRAAVARLLQGLQIEDVEGRLRPEPVLAESYAFHRR
jgi:hypothetical protein